MKNFISFLIFILLVAVNATTYTFKIDVDLISDGQIISTYPNLNTLTVKNAGQMGRKETVLNSGSPMLLKHDSERECKDCYFLIKFRDSKQGKSYFANLPYDLVNNKYFEDWLEISFNLDHDISSIRYGITKYLATSGEYTTIKESYPEPAITSPDPLEESIMTQPTRDPTVAGQIQPSQPEQEQSFFKKYFWWIVIGGFIAFQFLTVDKEKLAEAMQQQQAQGGR